MKNTYFVWVDGQKMDAFATGNERLDAQLLDCYEEYFLVGQFSTDEDALERVEEIQRAADRRADSVGVAARGENFSLEGGPDYAAFLYKQMGDEEIKVEA